MKKVDNYRECIRCGNCIYFKSTYYKDFCTRKMKPKTEKNFIYLCKHYDNITGFEKHEINENGVCNKYERGWHDLDNHEY